MEFVERFKAKASKARQAQSKLRMVERKQEQIQELPNSSRRYPTFRLQEQRHSGRDVLKVSGVTKSYGDKQVLHGVDLLVRRGDRLAIMGPNGIGKSTLLKIAMGEVAADSGEVEWGYETYPGYFAQDHHEDLEKLEMTAEQWTMQFCPDKGIGYVRGELALMLFSGDDPKKQLSALSGGEAARLVFARLAIEKPNVLVLDEPTNHLDLESIEALVEGLKAYEGTLIFVSHDRWFIGQLATRIVDIEASGVVDYQGTYEEYVAYSGSDRLDAEQVALAAKQKKQKEQQKKQKEQQKQKKRAVR
jgi:ATPase subunit of ABC transporter with duplicated ATPase domains